MKVILGGCPRAYTRCATTLPVSLSIPRLDIVEPLHPPFAEVLRAPSYELCLGIPPKPSGRELSKIVVNRI